MNQGQRTAQGQRAMQVQSDIFLGWTTIAGRDYLVRQLRDHKGAIENEDLEGNGLVQYGRVCGEMLSKGHARSGDSCAISGYLGNSDKFDKAMVDFRRRLRRPEHQGLRGVYAGDSRSAKSPPRLRRFLQPNQAAQERGS